MEPPVKHAPLVMMFLLMVAAVHTADAGTAESPMVGKWMAVSFMGQDIPEGTVWVENHADGTGTLHLNDEESTYRWFHDEETGTLSVTADGEESTYNIAVVDDTCTSTDIQSGDVVMVMERMPE